MSWSGAGDWLVVAGTALLTLGTSAQAWASLAEYRILKRSIRIAVNTAVSEAVKPMVSDILAAWDAALRAEIRQGPAAKPTLPTPPSPSEMRKLQRKLLFLGGLTFPKYLFQVSTKDGDDAVQLARYLRLVVVWVILMLGSVLGLAAACIQLALS